MTMGRVRAPRPSETKWKLYKLKLWCRDVFSLLLLRDWEAAFRKLIFTRVFEVGSHGSSDHVFSDGVLFLFAQGHCSVSCFREVVQLRLSGGRWTEVVVALLLKCPWLCVVLFHDDRCCVFVLFCFDERHWKQNFLNTGNLRKFDILRMCCEMTANWKSQQEKLSTSIVINSTEYNQITKIKNRIKSNQVTLPEANLGTMHFTYMWRRNKIRRPKTAKETLDTWLVNNVCGTMNLTLDLELTNTRLPAVVHSAAVFYDGPGKM